MRRLRALMQQFFFVSSCCISLRRGVDQMCVHMRVVKIPGAKSFLFPFGRLEKGVKELPSRAPVSLLESARGSREGKSRR